MRYIALFLLFHASLPRSLPLSLSIFPACGNAFNAMWQKQLLENCKKAGEGEGERGAKGTRSLLQLLCSASRSAAVCCVSFTLSFLTLPRLAVHCLARGERERERARLGAREKAANYKQIIAAR